ncbi:HTH-type transcriptional regulator VirS [Zhongshania aliphaticivorans]|uniref:HTH-type transcriptional regulator VirS n=1 Tax=Zhongshania aliphaticivorans TaxID=1470434 RepID=A0A5S9NWB5_9GAMM|nr:AraC family transcriptional regulator [Zhongshania aliphaticivorans]CAA0094996.1 HTH-type transcriptional regulator VirS [Zhongshania aliphaticivorans]CAA0112796.1 HTH-type transcriptional regulator VirS [Zhongshania aliphaticivorans]
MTASNTKHFSDLSDSSFLIQLVYPAMQNMGLDVERIVEECRISPSLLQDRSARFPHTAQLQFWRVLEAVSGDQHIGLHLAEAVQVYRGQVLEYLFLSSPNFGEGLKRAQNYQRLVTDAMQFELQVSEQLSRVCLEFAGGDDPGFRHRNECFARFLIRYFQAVTEGAFVVETVNLSHSAVGDVAEYERVFGCNVKFDSAESSLVFATSILATPSTHAEPDLLKLHEKLASKQLARLSRQDVVGDVRQIIAEMLELGQPSLETVAARLEMNERVLRSRLTEAGTSFNQVLADYRCVLAKRLLARTDESIADVVYLTGFSEPSTFYRAFKRWTELTPIEYRQLKKAAKPTSGD